jgi:asparagine synthetase B (glutamine-hydrolysing)
MCGICGHIYLKNNINIPYMLKAIKHRGPYDSESFSDDIVTLGMVRLSIINTIVIVRQPMCNEQKNIWIVCNGERYL